jgi:GT2 family glycosyltransferase
MNTMTHQSTNPLVSVVILSYNSVELLPRAVQSVQEQDYAPIELVIVDNASGDGTAALLDQYASCATVIRLGDNTGFARGMNTGYDASHGQYVVPLNTDAVLHPTFVRCAVELLEQHHDVGVIAPEVVRIGTDTPWRWWKANQQFPSEGGVVTLTPTMRVHVLEGDAEAIGDWRPSFKANGACPIIRRVLIEDLKRTFGAGPFDPVFDTYGEDVDFAFKAWALRWRTMYSRNVLAGHVRSYASPLALADKCGRLRINLIAERYINAVRHLPMQRMLPVVLFALAEDLRMVLQQWRKGDREAWPDVRAGLQRVWRMWHDLVRFRAWHRTWRSIDTQTEVYGKLPTE